MRNAFARLCNARKTCPLSLCVDVCVTSKFSHGFGFPFKLARGTICALERITCMTRIMLLLFFPVLAWTADVAGRWNLHLVRFGEEFAAARVDLKTEGTR